MSVCISGLSECGTTEANTFADGDGEEGSFDARFIPWNPRLSGFSEDSFV